MAFIDAIGSGYINYYNFETRASRSEYWWFFLYGFLAGTIIDILEIIVMPANSTFGLGPIGIIFTLFNIIPAIALSCRRLHDVGRSGWWQLLYFTIIGTFVLLYWYLKKGDDVENNFGYNPLGSIIKSKLSNGQQKTLDNNAVNTKVVETTAHELDEDKFYEKVATEMNNKDIKAGLWAKATVDAEGDEGKTKAFYIKYRVQNIQNEQRERLIEIELKNTQLKAEADQKRWEVEEKEEIEFEKKRLEGISNVKEITETSWGQTYKTQKGQDLMSQLNIKYDGDHYLYTSNHNENYKFVLLEHAVNKAIHDFDSSN
jgi:uncharacterized membrane protein YhaH (DUF805 family)